MPTLRPDADPRLWSTLHRLFCASLQGAGWEVLDRHPPGLFLDGLEPLRARRARGEAFGRAVAAELRALEQ